MARPTKTTRSTKKEASAPKKNEAPPPPPPTGAPQPTVVKRFFRSATSAGRKNNPNFSVPVMNPSGPAHECKGCTRSRIRRERA